MHDIYGLLINFTCTTLIFNCISNLLFDNGKISQWKENLRGMDRRPVSRRKILGGSCRRPVKRGKNSEGRSVKARRMRPNLNFTCMKKFLNSNYPLLFIRKVGSKGGVVGINTPDFPPPLKKNKPPHA